LDTNKLSINTPILDDSYVLILNGSIMFTIIIYTLFKFIYYGFLTISIFNGLVGATSNCLPKNRSNKNFPHQNSYYHLIYDYFNFNLYKFYYWFIRMILYSIDLYTFKFNVYCLIIVYIYVNYLVGFISMFSMFLTHMFRM
jgi:hypothetical protein